ASRGYSTPRLTQRADYGKSCAPMALSLGIPLIRLFCARLRDIGWPCLGIATADLCLASPQVFPQGRAQSLLALSRALIRFAVCHGQRCNPNERRPKRPCACLATPLVAMNPELASPYY